MTKLLERALAEAARLSDAEQDALASRVLAEIRGTESEWSEEDQRDATAFALNHAETVYPSGDTGV